MQSTLPCDIQAFALYNYLTTMRKHSNVWIVHFRVVDLGVRTQASISRRLLRPLFKRRDEGEERKSVQIYGRGAGDV